MPLTSTICSEKFVVLFLFASLPPSFLTLIAHIETVRLFNTEMTKLIGPAFLSLGQAPQIHGFKNDIVGVVFLSCTVNHVQNMMKKTYFLKYFLLITV